MEKSSLDDDFRKLVLDRFGMRQRSFVKQFTILIIFTVSFVAFFLAPMIALKLDGNRLAGEIKAKERAVAQLQTGLEQRRAEVAALIERQDSVNGELTSLNFVQAQKDSEASDVEAELARTGDRVDEIKRDQRAVESRVEDLREIAGRMSGVLRTFDAGERTDNLRDWFQDFALRGDRDASCSGDQEFGYYSCLVRKKLRSDWDGDFAWIQEEIISPLSLVLPEAAQSIGTKVAEVRASFDTRLNENPEFWHTINEKASFMDLLAGEFAKAFADIDRIVQDRMAAVQQEELDLEQEIARHADDLQDLQAALTEIENQRAGIIEEQNDASARVKQFAEQLAELEPLLIDTEAQAAELSAEFEADRGALELRTNEIEEKQRAIEQRLEDFQSPFGRLPLGLKEATLAFPFILAAGFIICALLLADLLRLRCEYHLLMESRSPSGPGTDQVRDRVTLLAPLWLDPVRPGAANLAVVCLLSLPALAFVFSVWLILSGVLQPAEVEPSDRYLRIFYYTLYAVGTLLVITGIHRVARRWTAYRERIRPADVN